MYPQILPILVFEYCRAILSAVATKALLLLAPFNQSIDQSINRSIKLNFIACVCGGLNRYTGRTLHGAGHNTSTSTRVALNIAYNSSFLKQVLHLALTLASV